MTKLLKFFKKKEQIGTHHISESQHHYTVVFAEWCCLKYPEQKNFGNQLRRAKSQFDRYYSIQELMNIYRKENGTQGLEQDTRKQ